MGYHPRNKHWPVSLNDDEKVADDDVVLVSQLDDLCYLYLGFCDDHLFQHPGNREI